MLSRHSGYAFTTTATPKGFLFSCVSCIFCFIVWDELLVGLRVPPVILLYKFQNYLAEGCKKGTRENRLTAILPQSSRSSRGIPRRSEALPLVLAPYHCLLQEVVIQTQISLNVIATVYKLRSVTILYCVLPLPVRRSVVSMVCGKKAPIREAEDLGWQYPSTHPPYRQC